MKQMDASFTFLHRIEEIESNLDDARWQSALALALTLPDICGGIAFPDVVKKYRDGRVRLDKQNNPTRDVGAQYVLWMDTYAADYFKINPGDESPYICGKRCWQLRCEYLHQNKGFSNDESETDIRFHLGVNCGTSVCQHAEKQAKNDDKDVHIEIQEFCLRMCQAARSYYKNVQHEEDFGLYNTPVIDFVKETKSAREDKRVFIVYSNKHYGEALKTAVEKIVKQVYVFDKFEKGKPDLWIISQDVLKEDKIQLLGKRAPIILISDEEVTLQLEKVKVLQMPVSPELIRSTVQELLE